MKNIIWFLILLILGGCATNPNECDPTNPSTSKFFKAAKCSFGGFTQHNEEYKKREMAKAQQRHQSLQQKLAQRQAELDMRLANRQELTGYLAERGEVDAVNQEAKRLEQQRLAEERRQEEERKRKEEERKRKAEEEKKRQRLAAEEEKKRQRRVAKEEERKRQHRASSSSSIDNGNNELKTRKLLIEEHCQSMKSRCLSQCEDLLSQGPHMFSSSPRTRCRNKCDEGYYICGSSSFNNNDNSELETRRLLKEENCNSLKYICLSQCEGLSSQGPHMFSSSPRTRCQNKCNESYYICGM